MSTAPGAVAKALLDAMPSLDFTKLVKEARHGFGIVIVGEESAAKSLEDLLRAPGSVPSDAQAVLWRHEPGGAAAPNGGKTELAIIVPATAEYLAQARESFSAVPTLGVLLEGQTAPEGLTAAVSVQALDAEHIRNALVPVLVDRLWERRLSLGRSVPATRDRIAWQLTQRAVRDVKVLLGTVVGAAGGRNGAPTPATAQLLIHQATLIVTIGAVYGADLEDRRALIARVAPNLGPTLLLDAAEAALSNLAQERGGKDRGKLYGTAAAVIARPALSASSTLIAGLAARRVFRQAVGTQPAIVRVAMHTRNLGRRAAAGVGQGAAVATGVFAGRLRRREAEPVAIDEEAEAAEQTEITPEATEPRAEGRQDPD